MIIESDCNMVVDAVNTACEDLSEFGCIVRACRRLLLQSHAVFSKFPPCLTPRPPLRPPRLSQIGSNAGYPLTFWIPGGVKPGTKNVHSLWLEISDGETLLVDSFPPLRTVNVVTVRILGKDNLILVESRQELSDGSVRDRFRPLSEKMKPNETLEEAVVRAVEEELGSITDSGAVRIVSGSYRKKLEERNSASYPGLPARNVLHSVEVWVEGLPDEDFCTEEKEEYVDFDGTRGLEKAVSVRKHYWKWVNSESVCS
ncbi:hypothetical protein DITRI_Ditri04bG0156200 [Diplodiscus trichospermus]